MLDKSSLSLADMMPHWREKGLVAEADAAGIEAFAEAHMQPSPQPVAVRVLSAIGAIIAMFCLLGFLTAVGLLDFSSIYPLFVFGWVLVGVALLANWNSREYASTRVQIFVQQCSLCLMLAGKFLLVFSLMELMPWLSLLEIPVALFLISMVIYPFYKVYIDRFLSLAVSFITLLFALDFDSTQIPHHELWFLGAFIAQLGCAYFLFTATFLKPVLMPVRQAAIAALVFVVIWVSWGIDLSSSASHSAGVILCMSLNIAIATAGLIIHLAPNRATLLSRPLVFAFPLLALLGAFGSPAWMFTLFLLVLGYGRQAKDLTALGLAMLPVTLFMFYYNLNITLLEKSGLLVMSGILLLATSAYLYTVQRNARKGGAA